MSSRDKASPSSPKETKGEHHLNEESDNDNNERRDEQQVTASAYLPSASRVDVHPLVLLSLVDHFARMNTKVRQKKRVVGLLLGRYKTDAAGTQVLDINNSFAVPFDEDPHNSDVWFFDTNYAEEMFVMHRRVHPKTKIVGWYASGPTVQQNDMLLHLLVADRFCANPVYCVVNTDPSHKGVPVLAYTTVQGREGARSLEFRNIPTHVGAEEAEEIGVEHLLRDLTDSTVTTLSSQLEERERSLEHMARVLVQIEEYLSDVASGALPASEDVLEALQELISLQPETYLKKKSLELNRFTNDRTIATFLGSIARCIGGLHEVILNRRVLARELKEIKARRAEAEEQRMDNEKNKIAEASPERKQ
ncbi:26S proteasome regulatory subunit N8 [Strigomonas culicis]|uniref:26S proteasome regulatory subunit N8 n=1 Tax=Strigomonas culicis TaxID=28005 RepID=S9WMT7_9TRYP|nr:26S proteasome regulatory subunit N8 [Strigomonas culicis]EPY37280.1 26S proteasome regulatory subunit N8 [Strigomonas culicis]|eukprot:EPY35012.1 26S proteasome regulatory subunit N8 [Strigomonas culicis]